MVNDTQGNVQQQQLPPQQQQQQQQYAGGYQQQPAYAPGYQQQPAYAPGYQQQPAWQQGPPPPGQYYAPQPYVVAQPTYIVSTGYNDRQIGESGDMCLGILLGWCLWWFAFFALMCREVSMRFIYGIYLGNAIVHYVCAVIFSIVAGVICNDEDYYDGDDTYYDCSPARVVLIVFAVIFFVLGATFSFMARRYHHRICCHPQYLVASTGRQPIIAQAY